jgi:hypothetical protein
MMNVSSRRWFPGIADVRSNIRGLPLPFYLFHLRAVIEAPNGKPRSIASDSAARTGPGQNNGRYVKPIPGSRNGSHNFLQHRRAFAPGVNAIVTGTSFKRTPLQRRFSRPENMSDQFGRRSRARGQVREQPTAIL